MKTRLFCIVIMLSFAACKDEGRVDHAYDVDPRLVGDWYDLDTLALAQPSPRFVLRGMRISAERTIQPLGIEFSTGRLALMETDQPKHILHANGGLLVVQYVAFPDIGIDTLHYAAQHNTLVLTDRYSTQIYRRISVGSQITEPLQAIMDVTIDSVRVRTPRVAAVVPVYVSRLQPSHLQFQAAIPNGFLRIDIRGFSGVGSYAIGPGDGVLMLFSGDVAFMFATDSSSPGTMSIEEYNEATNHCAGRFAFSARLPVPPHDPPIIRRLTDGSFSAPVYR